MGRFGIKANTERLVCGVCGHGKKGDFFPLIDSGQCPKCDNERRHVPLKQYLDSLIGLKMWHVAEFTLNGDVCQVLPVTIKAISANRNIILTYEFDGVHEYKTNDPTELYEDRAEAEREAARIITLAETLYI